MPAAISVSAFATSGFIFSAIAFNAAAKASLLASRPRSYPRRSASATRAPMSIFAASFEDEEMDTFASARSRSAIFALSRFGSFSTASRAMVSSCPLTAARSIGFSAGAFWLARILPLSKVSILGKATLRNMSSSGAQSHAVPVGSDGSDPIISAPVASSAHSRTHSRIAPRSCGAMSRNATKVSTCVKLSLCSFAGRWLSSMMRSPIPRPRLTRLLPACSILGASPPTFAPACGMKRCASSITRCSGPWFFRSSVSAKSVKNRVRSPTVINRVARMIGVVVVPAISAIAAPCAPESGRSACWPPKMTGSNPLAPLPSGLSRRPQKRSVGSMMQTRAPWAMSCSAMPCAA
ncbi:MAG TPA: hypothetical protein VGR91_19395 [Stellaceae bacterium]|nr:hypothetical protein [Stellaceae bacterium]